jgi:hypothetical protein
MERSKRIRKPLVLEMWVLVVFFAVNVDRHCDAFTFWLGIVMLAVFLPVALIWTYRWWVEARSAESEKGLNVS